MNGLPFFRVQPGPSGRRPIFVRGPRCYCTNGESLEVAQWSQAPPNRCAAPTQSKRRCILACGRLVHCRPGACPAHPQRATCHAVFRHRWGGRAGQPRVRISPRAGRLWTDFGVNWQGWARLEGDLCRMSPHAIIILREYLLRKFRRLALWRGCGGPSHLQRRPPPRCVPKATPRGTCRCWPAWPPARSPCRGSLEEASIGRPVGCPPQELSPSRFENLALLLTFGGKPEGLSISGRPGAGVTPIVGPQLDRLEIGRYRIRELDVPSGSAGPARDPEHSARVLSLSTRFRDAKKCSLRRSSKNDSGATIRRYEQQRSVSQSISSLLLLPFWKNSLICVCVCLSLYSCNMIGSDATAQERRAANRR